MGLLFALGLILAKRKNKGDGLEQIKTAPFAEHQIPAFTALDEPPSHH
jgi:hypothetical protein